MKKNKLLVSSTILVLPLLMANSPAPQAYPNKYDDATISYVKTGEINNEFIYDITITNNGNGYIDLNDSYFSYLQLDEKYRYGYELIAPNKSATVSGYISKNKQIDESDFEIYAYTEFCDKNYTISDVKSFSKTFYGEEDENHQRTYVYTYSVRFTLTELYEVDYHESCIYCVNYNGSDHYYYDYSVYSSFSFQTDEDLNVEDIALKPENTLFLKGRTYKGYNNNGFNILIIVVALCFVFPVIPGLIVALVFLIRGIVKKNKHKKDSVENK